MNKKKYALISVFDKKNLFSICKTLTHYNIGIISTGLTAKNIKSIGFNCKTISNLTKFPEILDGRVKTLHPKIHASLLYDRINKKHASVFNKLNFPIIDFVIINLYPFEKITKSSSNQNSYIDMIDIGGPTILRSAAKNFNSITAISDPKDYSDFIKNIKRNNGITSIDFRKKMAQKVFLKTSTYDFLISKWLKEEVVENTTDKKEIKLKYGENANQESSYHLDDINNSLLKFQISGRKIGYNNLLDLDAGLNCINEFNEPTCVIIKHNNPCGVASSNNIENAFKKAYQSDPLSAFGGVVLFNRKINKKLALLLSKKFIEILSAKGFEKNAFSILSKKEKLIIIDSTNVQISEKKEMKRIVGGFLIQEKNKTKIISKNLMCVSKKNTNKNYIMNLIFAYKVCKHVKSNAIVLVFNKQTIGIGAGQMNRFDSTKLALSKINKKIKFTKFVAASDGFFPFIDSIKLLSKNNCNAIVQPSGSKNDLKIIEFANKKNISLYFTKYRLFKH